jgi:type I restriction enzyme S subunit
MTSTWREQRLGDVVELQRGHDLPESMRRPGTVPVIGSAGLTGFHDTAKVHGPGVTVGRSGASFGKVTYVREDYWPHNAALFVKDFKGNDVLFVRYLLESIDFTSMNSGSAQQSLNRNYIYKLAVTIPHLEEQQRIAAILSTYDDLIENCERRIRVLDEMARALYREWFVRGGVASIPVTELVDVNPRVHIPNNRPVAFVPMSSLSTDTFIVGITERRERSGGAKFANGDTLMARITPCLENGKTAFVNFLEEGETACGSTEFIVLRGRTVPPEFVYCLARSEDFRMHAIKSMTGATGRQRVQEACFAQFHIPHPSSAALERFAAATSPAFRLGQCLQKRAEALRRTRDLLLPRLLSGQLSVGDAG